MVDTKKLELNLHHKQYLFDGAYFARLAYSTPEVIQNLFQQSQFVGENAHLLEINREYFHFKSTDKDAQCFITIYNPFDSLLISVRGSDSLEDWLHNLNTFKRSLKLEDVDLKSRPLVHSGFHSQFKSLEGFMDKHIQQYIQSREKKMITFVAHSLGAGVSSIASLYFACKYPDIKVCNVTFGSPRVGNTQFAKLYTKKLYFSRRLVNMFDPICAVPSKWRFTHTYDKIKFDKNEYMYDMNENIGCCAYTCNVLKNKMICKNLAKEHDMDKYYHLVRININPSLVEKTLTQRVQSKRKLSVEKDISNLKDEETQTSDTLLEIDLSMVHKDDNVESGRADGK